MSMSMIHRFLLSSTLLAFSALLAVGCSGTRDCATLCEEAQAGDCTIIGGSCSGFCSALDNVEGDAGCTAEREDYEACLDSEGEVCDASCGSEESDLTSCLGNYCLQNTDNPDCATLIDGVI